MNLKMQKKLQPYEKIIQQLEQQKGFSTIDLLGQGGFGTVIEIEDKKTKRIYALKFMSIYDGAGGVKKELLQFAQKEADILKNNQHINIVKYIDSFQIGTNYFIQMEKCAFSLQDWVDTCGGTKIQRKVFLNYAHQILNGIQFLHSRNLVLRDISLKNTLLSIDDDDLENDGIIKLCDFGCAKEIDLELESQRFMSTNQYGVRYFLPPEVMEQISKPRKVFIQDFKGDIWAYGVCLYILAGADLDHAIQLAKGKDVFQSQQCIDHDLNLFIKSILISNPNQRPDLQQISHSISILENDIKQPIYNTIQKPSNQFKTISSQECYEVGKHLQEQGKYNLSIEQFNQCLQIDPQHQNGNYQLGRIYFQKGNYHLSLQYCQKVLEINPEHAHANNCIAFIYYSKGNYDLSLQYYKKALEVNPEHADANNGIGWVYYEKGNYDLSLQYFKKALEINPKDAKVNYGLGWLYKKKRNYGLSLQYFMKALEINPEYAKANSGIGWVYYYKGNYDLSLQYFKKALEINPEYNSPNNCIGWVYYYKGNYDLSLQYFKKALEINPEYADANRGIGWVYYKKSNYDLSLQYFKKALELDPENADANNGIGWVYYNKSNYDLSLQYFKKALEINPENAIANRGIGLVYQKKGNYDLSLQYFKKALEIKYNFGLYLDYQKVCKEKLNNQKK